MNIESLVIILVIGAVAGWAAGTLMKGQGFGIVGNVIVGIIGAVVGGYIFGLLGLSVGGGIIGSLITATVGAIALLFVVSVLKKI